MHNSKTTYDNANVLWEESLTTTDTFTVVDLEGMKSKGRGQPKKRKV